MLSPSLEDYLEELYRASIKNKEIRIKDIAYCLHVSMPSVVKGLKKLHAQGYIDYRPYQKIIILNKGKKRGRFLVERNKILRDFVEIIGSECDIEEEAEAMEHYLTKSTIEAIEKLIRFFKKNDHILKDFNKFTIISSLYDEEKEK